MSTTYPSKHAVNSSVITSESFTINQQDIIDSYISSTESLKIPEIPPVSEKQDVHILPRIIAEAFACILDETINKLDLVTNVGQLPRLTEDEQEEDDDEEIDDGMVEKKTKKVEEIHGEIYDTVTLERLEDSMERQNLTKFVRNVNFVKKLLKKTCNSLLKKNSFDSLIDKVYEYKGDIDKRSQILDETLQIKKEISELVTSFNKEKKQALKEIDKMKKNTDAMRNSLGLKIVIENTKMHYVQDWEKSRNQLNTLILTRKEDVLNEKIERTRIEIEREERVNEEVEKFLTELQNDYEKEVEAWIERYDREMEQLDYDISVIKEKIEEQEIANAKIKQKYEERTKFIEDWLVHKEQKRLAKERFERMTESAISIQCWWRTVMIKKKLGPYGRKKGKGKGKGKGKK